MGMVRVQVPVPEFGGLIESDDVVLLRLARLAYRLATADRFFNNSSKTFRQPLLLASQCLAEHNDAHEDFISYCYCRIPPCFS
jgi:hypothetical protein